jgi:hypothetical protein
MHFERAMDYNINLPILEDLGGYKEIVYVSPSSEENERDALERIASYFKREFRYDHLQYCKDEHSEDCIGVLFTERAMDLVKDIEHQPNRVIGGACFRKTDDDGYFLDWIWFHPFSRNRKKLRQHWPNFKERFGQFSVTEPLSAQMVGFLKNQA